jgi:hypothetical protein
VLEDLNVAGTVHRLQREDALIGFRSSGCVKACADFTANMFS